MAELKPLCTLDMCPNFPGRVSGGEPVSLCEVMIKSVADGGGSSFLEMEPCPLSAMHTIALRETPEAIAVADHVGLIGVVDNDGWLD